MTTRVPDYDLSVTDFPWHAVSCVRVELPTEQARQMFHDINRLLARIDELEAEKPRWMPPMDAGDQVAYDRVNAFIAALQTELKIEPEINTSVSP